nr:hypothetical protein [Ktedonobacteraceae bacterium]
MKPPPRSDSSFPGILTDLSPDEMRVWIREKRDTLRHKMQRERAYLARRAARGIHTATDEAYEADQLLEADLLTLLETFDQHLSHLL